MLRRKPRSRVEFAPLLNPLHPRVLTLRKGRGRRDLARYESVESAQAALVKRAHEHLYEAKRMLRLAKMGLVENLKGHVEL
jgi:hypothetical protein